MLGKIPVMNGEEVLLGIHRQGRGLHSLRSCQQHFSVVMHNLFGEFDLEREFGIVRGNPAATVRCLRSLRPAG